MNEIQHAERVILKLMQGHAYPNEVEILTKVRQRKDNTHDLPKLSLRRNSSLIKLDSCWQFAAPMSLEIKHTR